MCKSLLHVYLYLVPFLRYSASNSGMTLKYGLEITQRHWKCHHSIDCIEYLLAFYSYYGPILYRFRDKARYWSKIAIF